MDPLLPTAETDLPCFWPASEALIIQGGCVHATRGWRFEADALEYQAKNSRWVHETDMQIPPRSRPFAFPVGLPSLKAIASPVRYCSRTSARDLPGHGGMHPMLNHPPPMRIIQRDPKVLGAADTLLQFISKFPWTPRFCRYQ